MFFSNVSSGGLVTMKLAARTVRWMSHETFVVILCSSTVCWWGTHWYPVPGALHTYAIKTSLQKRLDYSTLPLN